MDKNEQKLTGMCRNEQKWTGMNMLGVATKKKFMVLTRDATYDTIEQR